MSTAERLGPAHPVATPLNTSPDNDDGQPAGVSPSLRLQILATEHWSLLASRSLAWNESFSRAGMFLSTLSGAMVALALVAQTSGFGSTFVLFALVILPVALFVGVTTFVRLGASNVHDAQCVLGMNRIRGAYLEMAPELARYFVMSAHDDVRGLAITMGMTPPTGTLTHVLSATPMVTAILNSVLVGVIVSLIAMQTSLIPGAVLILGGAGFLTTIAAHTRYVQRRRLREMADLLGGQSSPPLFPSPSA